MKDWAARQPSGNRYVDTGSVIILSYMDTKLTFYQEGYLAKHAVSDEDRIAAEQGRETNNRPEDPMQGLEGLDVAGPKPV